MHVLMSPRQIFNPGNGRIRSLGAAVTGGAPHEDAAPLRYHPSHEASAPGARELVVGAIPHFPRVGARFFDHLRVGRDRA